MNPPVTDAARERRIRRWLAIGSLAFALLLCEVAARVLDLGWARPPSWRFHPTLGWTQPPRTSFEVESGGLVFRTSFNHLGFRDVERPFEKPSGVRRVVVLGDSYCEALQVPLENTFHKRLEKRLASSGGSNWEVINLGVGDFGSAQEWLALTRYGLRYQPDIVVLAFFPLNDLCNNSIELYAACNSPNDRYRPYFVDDGGKLRLTSAQPLRNFMRSHLRTFALAENVLERVWPPPPTDVIDRAHWTELLGGPWMEPFGTAYFPEELEPPLMRRAWSLTEKILDLIAKDAKDGGAKVLVEVMPFEQAVDGGQWDMGSTSDYPEHRLTKHFEPLGVPVVGTAEIFRQRRALVTPFIGGHPNSEGHRAMADVLYDRLAALGWIK